MHAYKWASEHTNCVSCDYPLIITKSKTMIGKLVLVAITLLVQQDFSSAQFTKIPSTTTAAELWNPYTWFWPYAIASAESYRDYYAKAQQATNELYQQIYATNANPLITGIWGTASPVKKPENITNPTNSTPTPDPVQSNDGKNSGKEENPESDNQNKANEETSNNATTDATK